MTKEWWKRSVVYEIYPRSFKDSNGDGIGDLNGITEKMDYLKELGIDVIWIAPFYKSPNDDNGYDISDYQAIMEEFGTMEDFDNMLVAAHCRGIKVIIDLVVNHTSDEHRWFIESRKSKENKYRDYYIWRSGKDGGPPNNWGSCFSGSAWEYDETTDMYYLHLFSRKQPDLNWANPELRKEIYTMMKWWLDKGVDGFRMDSMNLYSKLPDFPDGKDIQVNGYASFIDTTNGPHIHEYIQEMRKEILNKYDTLTVGECAWVTVDEGKKYANADGTELNMIFNFEHTFLDVSEGNRWQYKKLDLNELKKIMTKWQKGLEDSGWNSLYIENHDEPRSVSRYGDDSDKYWEISAKMLATYLHMMQGTPYIYQGQELGMTNVPFETIDQIQDSHSINAYKELVEEKGIYTHEEMMCNLQLKSRDNARTPFQWDDSDNAGFTSGTPWLMVNPNYKKINARSQMDNPGSIFSYYQSLIRLRKEKDIIVYGSYDLIMEESQNIYAYTRTLGDEKLLIVCNFSSNEEMISIPKEFLNGHYLITNYPENEIKEKMKVRSYEAFVIEK